MLVDSKSVVIDCYKQAGVKMPSQSWGHPWQEWLPALVGGHDRASEIRGLKNKLYLDAIHAGKVGELAGAEVLRRALRQPDVKPIIMSSASRVAVNAILKSIGVDPSDLPVGTGMAEMDKTYFLSQARKTSRAVHTVYVDDLYPVGSRIAREVTGVVKFVHFTTSLTPDELWRQVWTP